MLIVSQDKKAIINFNNVIALTIEQHEEYVPDKKYLINAETGEDEYIECGLYATEERAKEVLQKIIREYIDCNESKTDHWQYGYGFVKNSVYEMPED